MARVVVAAVAAGVVYTPAAAQPLLLLEPATMRMTEILGRQVDSAEGSPLGAIRDLLIDPRTRQVQFLALERGAYPVDALRSGEGTQLLLPEGSASTGASAPADFLRASDLMGRTLEDGAGKLLGKVLDVVVNLFDGTLDFVVIQPPDGGGPLRLPAADVVRN